MPKQAAILGTILIIGCQASPSPSPEPSPSPRVAVISPSPTGTAAPPSVAPPSVAPTSLPPPTTQPPNANPDWRQVAGIRAFRDEHLGGAVWTGTRFLAAGYSHIVESPDGLEWQLGQAFDAYAMDNFAVGPQGLVATPGPWFSTDGQTWTHAAETDSLRHTKGRSIQVSDAVATDGGWLAVGTDSPNDFIFNGFADHQGVVWHSVNGITWTRDPADPDMYDAEVVGVVRVGDGFVAVGNSAATRRQHAAVWRSSDGLGWDRVPDSEVFAETPGFPRLWAFASAVAARGNVVVMVGWTYTQDIGGTGLAWRSTDGGITWERAPLEGALDGQMNDVTEVPGGLAAIGWGRDCPSIWLSQDGASWTCAADPAMRRFSAWGVAASDTTLVLTGYGGGPVKREAVVWVHDLETLDGLRSSP